MQSLKLNELKKILRSCEVDPTDILAAKTRFELLELARHNGIDDVPDEWTVAKIKSQKRLQQQQMPAADPRSLDAPPAIVAHTGQGLSFFSRRARSESPAPAGAQGEFRPEGAVSAASNAAARRLARAQGRATDRGKGVPAGPLRGPKMRTHAELQRQVGFTDEQKAAVLAMRAARAEPPTGEAADPGLVSLDELKQLGYAPASLTKAGFAPQVLHEAGFTAAELAGDPKISAATLKELNYGPASLLAIGMTPPQLRQAGFSPAQLRREAPLTLVDLKAAGFTAQEFKQHGFSAAELEQAGFSKNDVRLAGFQPGSLFRKCKFTLADLRDAGFAAAEVRPATGAAPEQLIAAGFTAEEVRAAGYSAAALRRGEPEETGPPPAADAEPTRRQPSQRGRTGGPHAAAAAGDLPGGSTKGGGPSTATWTGAAVEVGASTDGAPANRPGATAASAPGSDEPLRAGGRTDGDVVAVGSVEACAEAEPMAGSGSGQSLREQVLSHVHELALMEPDERGTSLLINDVGEVLRATGKLDEAKKLFTDALAVRRRVLGNGDPKTLTSLNNLGLVLYEQRRYYEAMPLLEEAVAARRGVQGHRHPETLTAINNLAACHRAVGQLDHAEPLYVEALEARRSVLGNRHPDTLTSLNNLAQLYQASATVETLAMAEPLLKEALLGAKLELGEEHAHAQIFARNLEALQAKLRQLEAMEIRTASLLKGR